MASIESTAEEHVYGDDAPLTFLFRSPSQTKILSVFVAERGRDLTISQLARQAGVSRSSVYTHLEALLALGVVEQTRSTNDGHSPLYQLNEESEIARLCYQLEGTVLRRLLELEGHI